MELRRGNEGKSTTKGYLRIWGGMGRAQMVKGGNGEKTRRDFVKGQNEGKRGYSGTGGCRNDKGGEQRVGGTALGAARNLNVAGKVTRRKFPAWGR